MKTDPRVDAFIAGAAAFAQPLLSEMRKRIQKALPDAIETIKWRMPFYEINGKIVANMAAFKAHTKFGVWQDMKPVMMDARSAKDLPPVAAYTKQLKAAAEHVRASGAAKKASTKKASTKKAPSKDTPASGKPTKKR
ncbi:MAG TPA: DUF1801 domain-containing protein [Polyangiaceae bacterium]|nr:DUF1801 domain-containing protein [Polyangiaceae bacterium]